MLQSILEILLRAKGGTQTKSELTKVQKSVKSLSGMAAQLGLAPGPGRRDRRYGHVREEVGRGG